MSQERGPGRDADADRSQVSDLHEKGSNETSFLSLIGASASGLLQSSYGQATPSAVSSDLVSIHATASKGESSSSPTQGGPLSTAQASSVNQRPDNKFQNLGTTDSFRTLPPTNTLCAQEDFNQWSTSHHNLGNDALMAKDMLKTSKWPLDQQISMAQANTESQCAAGRRHEDVMMSDGAAVVSQLSNATINVDDMPLGMWESTALDHAPNAKIVLPNNGTNHQKTSASSWAPFEQNSPSLPEISVRTHAQFIDIAPSDLPKAMPLLGVYAFHSDRLRSLKDLRQINTYGLIPDFQESEPNLIGNNFNKAQTEDIMARISNAEELVEPWLHILDKYQDEVWGDMLPLVQEAREEVRKAEENKDPNPQSPRGGPALWRLKMVLQHMYHSRD